MINEKQYKSLVNILNYLYQNNHYYNERLKEKNIKEITIENIRTVYEILPPISKGEIVKNYFKYIDNKVTRNYTSEGIFRKELFDITNLSYRHDKFLSFEHSSDKYYVEVTSGTSGNPFPIIKNLNQKMIESYYLMKKRKGIFEMCNINNGLMLYHNSDPALRYADYNSNEKFKNMDTIAEKILTDKPKWIISTRLIILNLTEYVIINNLSEKFREVGIKFIETTGAKIYDDEKKIIEETLDTILIDQYGCREFWNIAYECKCGNLHVNNDYLIVDLVDENGEILNKPGEFGDIVVTNLTNRLNPFVKYLIGDQGRMYESNCSCGCTAPILVLEEGRKTEKLSNTDYYGNSVFRKVLRGIQFHDYITFSNVKIIQDQQYHLSVYVENCSDFIRFKEKFHLYSERIIKQWGLFSVDFYTEYPFVTDNVSFKESTFRNLVI